MYTEISHYLLMLTILMAKALVFLTAIWLIKQNIRPRRGAPWGVGVLIVITEAPSGAGPLPPAPSPVSRRTRQDPKAPPGPEGRLQAPKAPKAPKGPKGLFGGPTGTGTGEGPEGGGKVVKRLRRRFLASPLTAPSSLGLTSSFMHEENNNLFWIMSVYFLILTACFLVL